MSARLNDPNGLNVPGPGSYENEKYDYQSWLKGSGKYSLGKGPRDGFDPNKVPGPGSYYSKEIDKSGKISFGRDPKLKH